MNHELSVTSSGTQANVQNQGQFSLMSGIGAGQGGDTFSFLFEKTFAADGAAMDAAAKQQPLKPVKADNQPNKQDDSLQKFDKYQRERQATLKSSAQDEPSLEINKQAQPKQGEKVEHGKNDNKAVKAKDDKSIDANKTEQKQDKTAENDEKNDDETVTETSEEIKLMDESQQQDVAQQLTPDAEDVVQTTNPLMADALKKSVREGQTEEADDIDLMEAGGKKQSKNIWQEISTDKKVTSNSDEKATEKPQANFEALLNTKMAKTNLTHSQLQNQLETVKSTPTGTDKTAITSMSANGLTSALPSLKAGAQPVPVTPSNLSSLDVPFRQAGWDQAVNQRIAFMIGNNIKSAEIKINPPNLGLIEVNIAMEQDQARITFSVQQGSVKDALESALPKLKEMMEEIGVKLGDVNVSQQSTGDDKSSGDEGEGDENNGQLGHLNQQQEEEIEPMLQPGRMRAQLGLVDYFA